MKFKKTTSTKTKLPCDTYRFKMSQDTSSSSPFINETQYREYEREILSFMRCVYRNPNRLFALCNFAGEDYGSSYNDGFCQAIDETTRQSIMKDAFLYIIQGNIPIYDGHSEEYHLKWHIGEFGSRWFDIDPKKYDVSSIRVAFYSKKVDTEFNAFDDKHYAIVVLMEKSAY